MQFWLMHSLFAVIAVGVMGALYKVPSAKGHNKFLYSFLSLSVSTLLSLAIFYRYIQVDSRTILFSALGGAGFALVSMLQMELLKKLDTNALFPITSLSSHVLVVLIGISFFHDKLSRFQILGILLTFIIIGFYNNIHKHITLQNGLVPLAGILVLLSAFTKFIQKFGSISVEIRNFIFWQLLFAAISAFIILVIVKRKEVGQKITVSPEIIWWSIALGAVNFIGTAEIVKALSAGPISLVYTINSFYVLITSLFAWRFFGEKLTKRKMVFVLFAILAIILIGFG